MKSRSIFYALPLVLTACQGATDDPGSVSHDEARQLNDAAVMLDANSVDMNAIDINASDEDQPQ